MWLMIFLIVLFALTLGGGRWRRSRYGNWGWSPAVLILMVAAVLFYTGHLNWH